MLQEIFGSNSLSGLKSTISNVDHKNGEINSRFGPNPDSGIEMREWVYQCAFERATEVVENRDIDVRYGLKLFGIQYNLL